MGVAERFTTAGPLVDLDRYAAFLDGRAEEEKWQLVDGVALRIMNPPSIIHQRIAMNLATLLNMAMAEAGRELFAYCEIGVRNPDREDFQPEPDVVVGPRNAPEGYWTADYSLVAEVLSPSNSREMIDRKVELYAEHPINLHVIVVAQDAVKVVHRARATDWLPVELYEEDRLVLAEFGLDVPVVDLYRGTKLDPR